MAFKLRSTDHHELECGSKIRSQCVPIRVCVISLCLGGSDEPVGKVIHEQRAGAANHSTVPNQIGEIELYAVVCDAHGDAVVTRVPVLLARPALRAS